MMKNVIDCLMGGISYWAIGHGLCVGRVRLFHDDDDDDLHMVMTVMMMVVIMVIFPGILEQPFFRVGRFLFDSGRAPDWAGLWNLHIFGIYHFLFFFTLNCQLSYATTCTTIISGAIAERTNLYACG